MIRALMVSPKAKGLFKRAILQSDPMNYPIENRTISCDIIGAAVLSSLGCSDVTCARALPVSQLVSATQEICSTGMSLNPMVPVTPLMPTIDGTWVSSDWSEAIESDSLQSEVDVIMGKIPAVAVSDLKVLSPTKQRPRYSITSLIHCPLPTTNISCLCSSAHRGQQQSLGNLNSNLTCPIQIPYGIHYRRLGHYSSGPARINLTLSPTQTKQTSIYTNLKSAQPILITRMTPCVSTKCVMRTILKWYSERILRHLLLKVLSVQRSEDVGLRLRRTGIRMSLERFNGLQSVDREI